MHSTNWIFSEEASVNLQLAEELQESGQFPLAAVKKLRKNLPMGRVQQILDLSRLRGHAVAKFSKASRMYFTQTQLEQSTSEAIANYKAQRFTGMGRVADLCCGIGGDAIGLAQVADLQIVDSYDLVLEMARRNVKAYGKTVDSTLGKAETFDVGSVDAFHLDPDRRTLSESEVEIRTIQPDSFSPDLENIRKLESLNPNFGIKIAPGSTPWSGEYEIEFISHQRECKQQILWSGALAKSPGVTVTNLDNLGQTSESFHRSKDEIEGPADFFVSANPVAKFIYDPKPSLRVSPLLADFARSYGLHLVDRHSRYLSSDQSVDSQLLTGFEVLDLLKPDRNLVLRYLRERNAHTPEIRKRDKKDEAYRKLRTIRLKGENLFTIILSGTTEGYRAIMCKRLSIPNPVG